VARAVEYYRLSPKQISMSGLRNFGRCLVFAIRTRANVVQGIEYIRLSAELGDQMLLEEIIVDAEKCRGDILEKLTKRFH
jgi:hypothetical protein